ncbi:MAG: hypothetical protein WCO45_10020 [Pseudanabaena sp. ELA607]|jgi:hypothetical protein
MNCSRSDLYDGFRWAVPTAFRNSLATCSFNEGAMLYDTPKAYSDEVWAIKNNLINYSIQVLKPANTGTELQNPDSESIFLSNWTKNITVCLYTHPITPTSERKQLQITNGQLFSLLWKGEKSVLDSSTLSIKPPKMTIKLVSDLTEREENSRVQKTIALEEVMRRVLIAGDDSQQQNPNVFIMPFDPVFDILIQKSSKLNIELANKFVFQVFDINVSEVELVRNTHFPTALLRCFIIDSDSSYEVQKVLQDILQSSKSASISSTNLARHGKFIPFAL